MGNEVEKFDPATLMQGVKDRIKATFISLIPDEQWEQMVQSEINKYFKTEQTGYRSDNYRSDFTNTVYSVLQEETKKKITEVLSTPEFTVMYTGPDNQLTVSDVIKAEIIKKAPEIFASVLEGAIGNVIQQLKNRGY